MPQSNRVPAQSPWTRVRSELQRSPQLRRSKIGGGEIHDAWCTCRSCLQRDAQAYRHRHRVLQAWAILFIILGAALYGLILASLPQIAAAFGWGF